MCHFYLQHPPSCKCFDPWDVKHLLSLLESWAPASSITTFKLAWKTATLLELVTAKHCSDLTLLCIDNQHLFLQHNAAIFIPMSGSKTDCPGHLPPQIHIESHSNVNLCPVFYLKAYLRCTESFRMKPDGSCVTSLFSTAESIQLCYSSHFVVVVGSGSIGIDVVNKFVGSGSGSIGINVVNKFVLMIVVVACVVIKSLDALVEVVIFSDFDFMYVYLFPALECTV